MKGMLTFLRLMCTCKLKGLGEWLLVVKKSKGLTFVKDEVPSSSPVGGDRWCIMSLAMIVGGLEVV
jgi:hypothetical protein